MSAVMHVQGFSRDGEVRGVSVAQHEGSVIEIAKGVIETAAMSETTEIVSFRRTWPIDAYGHERSVVRVEAVTKTTLDGGETWMEMWHVFTTPTSPWPTSPLPKDAS